MIEAEHVRRGKKAAIIADAYARRVRKMLRSDQTISYNKRELPAMVVMAAKEVSVDTWTKLAEAAGQHAPSEETIGVILGILEAKVRSPHVARRR